MSQLWADDDELRTFKHLRCRRLSVATIAARMGRPPAWVEQMVQAAHLLPRADQTPSKVPAPPRRANDCAKHLRAVWKASAGGMFPYGVGRRRPMAKPSEETGDVL